MFFFVCFYVCFYFNDRCQKLRDHLESSVATTEKEGSFFLPFRPPCVLFTCLFSLARCAAWGLHLNSKARAGHRGPCLGSCTKGEIVIHCLTVTTASLPEAPRSPRVSGSTRVFIRSGCCILGNAFSHPLQVSISVF